MKHPAPLSRVAGALAEFIGVLRRHILLCWIGAALAFAALGCIPLDMRQELQQFEITKLAPDLGVEGQGFAANSAATLFSAADPEFGQLTWFDSWLDGRPSTGRVRTSAFPLPRRGYLLVAGYPNAPESGVWLEFQDAAGRTSEYRPRYENPGERWELAPVAPPDASERAQFRLVGSDAQMQGWLGFSEPFTLDLSTSGQLFGLAAQALACLAGGALIFLPGLALRGLARGRAFPLALLPLPGVVCAAAIGLAIWIRPASCSPQAVALGLALPGLLGLAWFFWRKPLETLLTPLERRVLALALLAAGLAVAKAGYAVGPLGDLYQDRISRTLETGDRSDSRISYHLTQLAFHQLGPYREQGKAYYAPWSFSSRGPIPGLAATALMALAGAAPSLGMPEAFWRPFDMQGFAVYRIAMIVMAAGTFVMFFGAVSLTLAPRWAFFAAAVAATTPFLLHETYFTWPKLQAAGIVCAAAWLLAQRRPLAAGLCLGLGYLAHPLVLLSSPAFACLAAFSVWNERPTLATRLRAALTACVLFGLGLGAFLLAWRLLNGPHFGQGVFWEYLTRSEKGLSWSMTRVRSLLNTLVPLHLLLVDSDNPAVNSYGGRSPEIIHFFFQYWNTAPFGFGILAAPALLAGLYQAARRHAWQCGAFVALPLLFFTIFWGACITGMLREGLHVWVLSVVYVFALGLQSARGRDGRASAATRWLLGLRAFEIMAMLVLPAALSRGEWLRFPLNDAVALGVMAAAALLLARNLWREGCGRDRGGTLLGARPSCVARALQRPHPGGRGHGPDSP